MSINDMANSTLTANKIAIQTGVRCASLIYLEKAGVPTLFNKIAYHYLIDKWHCVNMLYWSKVIVHPARAAFIPCLLWLSRHNALELGGRVGNRFPAEFYALLPGARRQVGSMIRAIKSRCAQPYVLPF